MNFLPWLSRQDKRNDHIGEFARLMNGFSIKSSAGYEMIINHLISRKDLIGQRAFENFCAAWNEYSTARNSVFRP